MDELLAEATLSSGKGGVTIKQDLNETSRALIEAGISTELCDFVDAMALDKAGCAIGPAYSSPLAVMTL